MSTALVTGGTSGIGAAFARALAARGDDLVLVARDEARLETMAAALHAQHGVQVETVRADLSLPEDVELVAKRLAQPDRPIDLLVNNAGFGIHARLTDPDPTAQLYGIDVMIRAVLLLSAAAGRTMAERGSGHIVNVSSTAAFVTLGGYSAIKAWVLTYSEGLAVELAGTGVGVTALCPGWVRTEFHGRAGIHTSSIPAPMWTDVDQVVAECLHDVARGRVISIPSRRYRVLMFVARHAPRSVVRAASARIVMGRRGAQ